MFTRQGSGRVGILLASLCLTTVAVAMLVGRFSPTTSAAVIPQGQAAGPVVGRSIKHDTTTIPLRDTKSTPLSSRQTGNREDTEVMPPAPVLPRVKDPVVQTAFGPDGLLAIPTPIVSFDGLSNLWGAWPPDTNGDVGPEHYVQTVNAGLWVFDKAGTPLTEVIDNNRLWQGFGGLCESTNRGDPVALYDPIADRWLMSQFAFVAVSVGPYYECVAISTTGDPTGTWHRYAFETSTVNFPDYPKAAVWPDAYYFTYLPHEGGVSFIGQQASAYERAAMLDGQPARQVDFTISGPVIALLASDLDGDVLPPAGMSNVFAGLNRFSANIETWEFRVDWTNPLSSTFTQNPSLAVAPFTRACPTIRTCVPQPNTNARLDDLSDWLTHRFAYRNFGTHHAWVTNHTVDSGTGGVLGVRWYELRSPSGTDPTLSVHQQGTYAPDDGVYRWMGSVGIDVDGNIGLGYSASSSSLYPSVRYTGRLASDPAGTMPQGEGSIVDGGGSQTTSQFRWGDYSSISVDPQDECTFWFTTEYYTVTSSTGWSTRIGSFKFPSCPKNPPTPEATRTATSSVTPINTDTRTPTYTGTPTPPPSTGTLTTTPTPCAIAFADVQPADYFYEPVRYMFCNGIISGYADNTFRPFNNTTRGQLTKIVVLGFGIPLSTNQEPTFQDVPPTDTFFSFIETAAEQQLVAGYSCGGAGEPCVPPLNRPYFRPYNLVTRGQLAKITVVAAQWETINPPNPTFTDVPPQDAFYNYVETAVCHAIISGYGDGTFRPGSPATRGQIAKIVYLAILDEAACN